MKSSINSIALVFQTISHNKTLLMRYFSIITEIKNKCISKARQTNIIEHMNACNKIDIEYDKLVHLIKEQNEFEKQCVDFCNAHTLSENDLDTINAVVEQLTVRFNAIRQNILIQEKICS